MYGAPDMTTSQKKSATRAGRPLVRRSNVKHSTDKRSIQNQNPSQAFAQPQQQRFLIGGSEMVERIRAFDWASTGLGPISNWSERVRTAVAICADIASVQQKRLVAARCSQGRRVTELSKRNKALLREVAKHKEAAEVVRPQLEALIEELRFMKESLQNSENRLQAIADSSPSLIFLKDTQGHYVLVNKGVERAVGTTREQIIGKSDEDLFAPHQAEVFRANDLEVLNTGAALQFEQFVLTDSGPRWSIVQKFPLFDAGGTICSIGGIVTDISERKRAEEALREAREELARVSRLTAMGQLTASIAHEINQPLTAIVANSDTCLHWLGINQPDLGKARAAAERMARDARHASNIIAHIRSLMNKTVSERALVDINQLIQGVLDLTHGEMRKRKVSVDIELSKSIPMIFGDRVQLQQVILNLVLNSIEAMTPVRDRPRRLLVKSQPHGTNNIEVSLHDTGVGFDSALADRIFDAFFTTKPNGTGMGLSICRSIVEAHGGQVSAIRGTPHGAVFQVKLPMVQ
jgi:PAS domain S-box-containing protein